MINPRVSALSPSATLKITSLTKKLKKEGKDVVNFAAGEPDFDTPDFIKEAAKKAIDQGHTKYTPSSGTVDLRDAIAKKLHEENGIPCEGKNIIVTCGAKYAIFAAIIATVSRGDEVLLATPYWVSYPEMVKLAGGKVKFIRTDKKDNFKIRKEKIEKSITAKTKLLILNYPNNPTGITYSLQELEEIRAVAATKDFWILSDEIYEMLVYDGRKHTSFASLDGMAKRTITVNGFSKTFSMTGWRLGYLAADSILVEQIAKIIDHTTSCASSVSQIAALAALQNTAWPQQMRKEFENRRNLLYNGLGQLKAIQPIKTEGTFYMFCDIRKSGLTSADFSSRLLEKHLVSTIPADSFGAEGFIRLSFATSTEDIKKGIERIKTFAQSI
ncbi:MAG: pyridoxal phosphate-dependent aminotransferase [Candidatus Omnitrophota bacterium]